MVINNQFYKATFDDKGKWSIDPKIPSVTKKESSGKETPRYPVIVEYENDFKRGFDTTLKSMVVSMGKVLDKV